MAQFFKYFLASLLALVVFVALLFFLMVGIASALASKEQPLLEAHSVLFLDLGKHIREQKKENPFGPFLGEEEEEDPGVYDLVRMIRFAKTDDKIDGIYLKCGSNANGLATNEELRTALKDFRNANKFVIAFGEIISQQAYHVAAVADKVYAHPLGGIDWKGFGLKYIFFKKALDKLEIQPQIFYAGKFKSATEPFREDHMTDANRLQSTVLLEDIYRHFLAGVAKNRSLDSAQLRSLANTHAIRTAEDAVKTGLLDGLKYEDEIKEEIRRKTNSSSIEHIHFVSMAGYAQSVQFKKEKGAERIAIIYAQGDIVDGSGDENNIGGDRFRKYIRKARLDKAVKAIVIRINSGGGSVMASENLSREIALAKKDKPVVVSFGDVAASGGYYMACNADSIFALQNTITGSIGVFSIIPNLHGFLSDKLGITFDEVETGPYANTPSAVEPLTEMEKRLYQAGVDSIYHVFLNRVAVGRKMTIAQVDSLGQGRVWSGKRALELGLVDKLGGMKEAVAAAAKLAGIGDYRTLEYPVQNNILERLRGAYKQTVGISAVRRQIGEEYFQLYEEWETIRSSIGHAQMKLPCRMIIQ